MRDTHAVTAKFRELFGAEPELVSFAPGRVNLIGEHTDYNGGHVFPCALGLGITCAARAREDSVLRFFSLDIPDTGMIESSLDVIIPCRNKLWTAYPEGVIYAFNMAGFPIIHGMDLLFYGDIPAGVGLSSSAALEVATGTMLAKMFGYDIPMPQIALLGQYAENRYVGMNCGIMDQFASAMGKRAHAIFLDTATLDFDYAPIMTADAELVIVDSRVKHSLTGSAYNDRRRECEEALYNIRTVLDTDALCHITPEQFESIKDVIIDPVCRKRAKHAVYENARTVAALEALTAGDIWKFGQLMNESHISLRDDYEVSCEELDILTELAWSLPGVIGARMTGGGFGGCMVCLVLRSELQNFTESIRSGYIEKTGLEARFVVAKPGDGAHMITD